MTDEIRTRIIADISEMTRLSETYGSLTSEITNTDIDETLSDILSKRAEVISSLGKIREDINDACEECTEQEKELIRRMINGTHVPLGMSQELKEIHKAAIGLHSAYISASGKDKQAAARIDARVKELRSELSSVNEDRKKTVGYNAVGSGLGGSGGSFDGRL